MGSRSATVRQAKRRREVGQAKGGMNTKLHAVTDTGGRPIGLFITAGQVSDYTGAMALRGDLPDADWLFGHRGYDADWLQEALIERGTRSCIPDRKSRKKAVRYDKRRYRRRNRHILVVSPDPKQHQDDQWVLNLAI